MRTKYIEVSLWWHMIHQITQFRQLKFVLGQNLLRRTKMRANDTQTRLRWNFRHYMTQIRSPKHTSPQNPTPLNKTTYKQQSTRTWNMSLVVIIPLTDTKTHFVAGIYFVQQNWSKPPPSNKTTYKQQSTRTSNMSLAVIIPLMDTKTHFVAGIYFVQQKWSLTTLG